MLNYFPTTVRVAATNLLVFFCVISVSACVTYEYHETSRVELSKASSENVVEIDEETLLDIGIIPFDTGVDITDDVSAAYSNVRESEAVWFAGLLKASLDRSNAWGAVRAMPTENPISDIVIEGKIVDSSGEMLILEIIATDAVGNIWFANEYSERASAYSYDTEVSLNRDPFQSLFNRIANDLFDYRVQLTSDYLLNVRNIAKLRFASKFAPKNFDEFLHQDQDGLFALNRIPAESDPMLVRVERIRARNELFLDVIQDYYRVFNKNMSSPYGEWRKLSYKDVVYERQLKKRSKQEKVAGIAVMVGSLLTTGSSNRYTRAAGGVGVYSGASLFREGYNTEIASSLHAEAVRELGESLEAELEPSVIDLQDRSVTLSGTVEEQYREWRRILSEMFVAEEGLSDTVSISANDGTTTLVPSDPVIEPTLSE